MDCRFFFHVGDRDEPPHVPVERDDKIAKVRLDPIRLQRNGGFSRREIDQLQKLLRANNVMLLEA